MDMLGSLPMNNLKAREAPPPLQTHLTCSGAHTHPGAFLFLFCAGIFTHTPPPMRTQMPPSRRQTQPNMRSPVFKVRFCDPCFFVGVFFSSFLWGFWQHPGWASLFISTPQRARIQVRAAAAAHSDGARSNSKVSYKKCNTADLSTHNLAVLMYSSEEK